MRGLPIAPRLLFTGRAARCLDLVGVAHPELKLGRIPEELGAERLASALDFILVIIEKTRGVLAEANFEGPDPPGLSGGRPPRSRSASPKMGVMCRYLLRADRHPVVPSVG